MSCPSTFFGSTCTISSFGERFRDGQNSLVSFLFAVLLLTVPPPCVQPFLQVRSGTCPRACVVGATDNDEEDDEDSGAIIISSQLHNVQKL